MMSVINTGRAATAILADQKSDPGTAPATETTTEPAADTKAE